MKTAAILKPPYGRYFTQTNRYSVRGKAIAILRGEHFEDFLVDVKNDDNLEPIYRAFLLICFCGGLRVNEGLSLGKVSFYRDGNHLFADVDVLKKRRPEQRTIMLHPLVSEFVERTISTVVGKLFKWDESTCYRRLQYFGVPNLTTHSSRHSAISYYLFEKRLSREEVAKLIHVSVSIIDRYSHADEKKLLRTIFSEKKAA